VKCCFEKRKGKKSRKTAGVKPSSVERKRKLRKGPKEWSVENFKNSSKTYVFARGGGSTIEGKRAARMTYTFILDLNFRVAKGLYEGRGSRGAGAFWGGGSDGKCCDERFGARLSGRS